MWQSTKSPASSTSTKKQTAANEAKAKAKRTREADETEQRNQSSRRLQTARRIAHHMHNRRLKLERREQGGQMQEEIEEMGDDLRDIGVN